MTHIVESKVICPRCKSSNLLLIELWKGHTIEWEQINGKFDRNDGNLEAGNPYKVEAVCRQCKHGWTIQKANQIDHVLKSDK